jgi:NAD(P)-dependent dehydrogenase (short-subunit alcohol dehydrogenase family)
MLSLPLGYHALIIGASGSIGHAFAELLGHDPRCAKAFCLSRSGRPSLLLEDQASIASCAQELSPSGPFHLIVDATGALSLDGRGPEKRLDDLDAQSMLRAYEVNAVGPALLLKHFAPLLATQERVIWAKLSARVGSIEDNHKGGWYGYRSAKAGLNMILQTAAIEISRRRPLAVIAALQPGTVRSGLSAPFVGDIAMDPLDSATGLMTALDGLAPTGRAHFIDHQGQSIPW